MEELARYSLSYRAAEARQVMNWVKGGQCGCLIGLRGAGKSNFLRFLLREDIRQHYLGQEYPNYAFVLIDLLSLVENTPWAICELMLDRMLNQLRPWLEEKMAVELATLQQEITYSKNLLGAQRAIERCVEIVCRQPTQQIVLLFDEFDDVFRVSDPLVFRYLRSLRDAHKKQLSYLIISANDLVNLRDDLNELEHFYRLVSRNVCGLGPYTEEDARRMIRYLEIQRATEMKAGDITRLIEISGGHAGLLKAILSLLWESPETTSLTEMIPGLEKQPRIQAECRKVWASLTGEEQAALEALANRLAADSRILPYLKRKGLVRQGRLIFSPLFADFIRRVPKAITGVTLNHTTREVQIARRMIGPLTEMEFRLLSYFCDHPGQLCTKNELIEALYSPEEGALDETLQTLISRLRKKIEPDYKHPRYLITIRRMGYKFVGPENKETSRK